MTRIDTNDGLESEILEETLNRARRVTGAKAEILKRILDDTVEQGGANAARAKQRRATAASSLGEAAPGAAARSASPPKAPEDVAIVDVPGSEYTRQVRQLKYDISAIRIQRITRDFIKGLRGPRSLRTRFVQPPTMSTVVV
jgi:hypothetical protein